MSQMIEITVTQTYEASREFTLEEVEEAAGMTLEEAGSLQVLVDALRDAGTLTDTMEKWSECIDSDWVGKLDS